MVTKKKTGQGSNVGGKQYDSKAPVASEQVAPAKSSNSKVMKPMPKAKK